MPTLPDQTITSQSRKKVVIVGGGFAGLNAAKALSKRDDLDITLLDRRNYHLFQPLLYQVAMAGLSPGDIATPIRTIMADRPNVRVLLAEVKGIDLNQRVVQTDFSNFSYDYLIMACGAQHSYFGNEQWEEYAPGLKTLEQATEIRRRVLLAFEMAERESDPERIKRLLTFAIVGGGPTGVELAGTLGEITRYALSSDFRHIDPTSTRIVLIEAGPRILPSFDQKLGDRAVRDLQDLGVTIRTNSRVTNITEAGVNLGDELLDASTVLWAAGVRPSALNALMGTQLDRAGRVVIGQDLSLPGYPEVFVLGDQAAFIENGKPLPGLAPVAMQQGRAAAANVIADLEGKGRKPFRYVDKGQMATIGRRRAIAQSGKMKLTGVLAWYAWLVVHVYYLIGFKNRAAVLLSWFWNYLTYKRGAQLITYKEWRSFFKPGEEQAPPARQPGVNKAVAEAAATGIQGPNIGSSSVTGTPLPSRG